MTPQQTIIVMLIILVFSFIGFGYVINSLIKKMEQLKKPKIDYRIDLKKMEKVMGMVKGWGLEERLRLLQYILGNSIVYLHLEGDKIIITGVGKVSSEEEREPIDYTG